MAKHENPGKVDVEKAAESILENGGGMTSRQTDNGIHNTVYSEDDNRRLSWDERPDGSITNVHTSKNGRSYMQYSDD